MNLKRAQIKARMQLLSQQGIQPLLVDVAKEADIQAGNELASDEEYGKGIIKICNALKGKYKQLLEENKQPKVKNYDLEQAIKDKANGTY